MTNNSHPITPSIELVKQWSDQWHNANDNDFDHTLFVSIQAARWGAQQKQEECDQLKQRLQKLLNERG